MKVFLDSIGCRLNQSEIEKIAAQFLREGWELALSANDADLAVINTCAVTAKAAADSRQLIRRTNREVKTGIAVTGCWSTLQPEEAAKLPGVMRVVANLEKENMVRSILDLPPSWENDFLFSRTPLPGNRRRTRAFIKIQDGCDQHCTYCVTRLARGKSRSRALKTILLDVQSAVAGGTKEVVLTGVQLGSWGKDFTEPMDIEELINTILMESDVPRIHLSSIEPWDIDEELVKLWENQRLARHLHIPLQSGSKSVLSRMARKTNPEQYSRLINLIRDCSPDMAITTDVIAGFPGESDQEFEETCDFINSISFSGGHAFSYSARPGTAAADFRDQILPQIIRKRVNRLHGLFKEIESVYRVNFIGKQLEVLWEKVIRDDQGIYQLQGLSRNNIKVISRHHANLYNQVSKVLASGVEQDFLVGSII